MASSGSGLRARWQRPPGPPRPGTREFTVRAVVLLTLVGLALVLAYAAVDRFWLGEPPRVDEAVLAWFVESRGPVLVAVSRVLAHLGDLAVVVPLGVALVVLVRWHEGRWDAAVLAGTVVLGGLVVTAVLKELTVRARPDDALVDAVSFAFPSGHASRAAAVSALLYWLSTHWGHRGPLRASLALLSISWALATGLSRLVLGVHWPSDVLAGWLLGWAWAAAVLVVTRPVIVEIEQQHAEEGPS